MKFQNYKIKKKSGFTLIEVLISISIILTMTSVSLNAYKNTIKLKDSLVISEEQNRLMAFMLNCKAFCASNNKAGIVYLDMENNQLLFEVDLNDVMVFKLQDGLKFYEGIRTSNLAYVGSNGKLKVYGALQIEDTSGKKHSVNFNVALGTMNAL
ncbi:MAG: type II secretion system protein [Clostridiaceae bacterium]